LKFEGGEMSQIVLLKEVEKYAGKYVAKKTFRDEDAITAGDDPVNVYNDAKKKGVDDPVIFYVPKKDVVNIY
jgi:hypothetical protein